MDGEKRVIVHVLIPARNVGSKLYFMLHHNMSKRKIIQITIFILITAFFAYALWWMFWRQPPAEQLVNVNGELVPLSKLPQINEGLPPGVVINSETGLPEIVNQPVNAPLNIAPPPVNAPSLPSFSEIARGGLTRANLVVTNKVKGTFLAQDGQTLNFYNSSDNKFYRLGPDGKAVPLSDKKFQCRISILVASGR